MNLSREDAWILLLCTIRYAFGRKTYIVSESINLFHKYKSLLSQSQVDQIYDEVKRELEVYESLNETCGHQCDHDNWKRFLETRRNY